MTAKTTVHHDPSDSRARLPNWIAVLLIAVSMIFIGSAMTEPAHAQGGHGEIPSITLDSNQPGQLVITWETPDPAPTDYRIMWANTNLGFPSYKNPNEAERANEYPLVDVNTLTLSNLTPGDSYKVKIRSRYYNADRSVHKSSGPWTQVMTQRVMDHPPAAPNGLAASQVSHDSLTLTWDDPQDANITGYRVMRGPDAGSLSTLANTQSDSTSFADSTVEPETTYHYGVLALSQDGDGEQSTISVTTPAEPQPDPPAAPTGLTASNVQHDSLTLNWDDPEDDSITGYRVLRGPDADNLSTIEEDTEGTSTEYEDETVSPETTYFYAVLALSQDGNSVQSGAISATTPAAPSSGEQNEPREAPKKKDPPQRVGPRQAVTTDVWTATLTPADISSVWKGCRNNCDNAAILSDDTFTYDSTNYTIQQLTVRNSPSPLFLGFTPQITTATRDLSLVVGSTSFAFADATIANVVNDVTTVTWSSPGLSWTVGTDVNVKLTETNTAPTVANAIPDQEATVDTAFSYTFLANTFNDVDVTDTLTYTAKKADDSALPTWLTFTDTTRAFSGTPTAAETVSVKVTASDGTASVSDEFDIVVSPAGLWTATLTPADFGSGNLGCNNASPTNKCSTAAVLSDDDFTYDSTSYSFTTLNLNATSFSLTVDADITAATTNDLTIVVGSTSLAFAEATTQTARTKTWFNPGFSWTAGTDVSMRIIDLAPPSLTSAVVLADGNTIQLAFSEDLQSANLPPAAAFTVTAGGSAVTVTGIAAESTADVLQITVSPLIGQGQTVVVAYEDPTAVDDANAIQDAAGNDTPDFTTGSGSVPAVTNNSALINEVLASWSLTPAGLGRRRPVPVDIPLIHQAQRLVHRHRGLQHLRPGPRRSRPHRHPRLQRGLRGDRLHFRRRRPRQHRHHWHWRPHLLARRHQGRRRLPGFLRRVLGR